VVAAWNGMAVGALATAARALAAEDPPLAAAFPVDGAPPRAYLAAAQAAAGAVRSRLWDARAHRLKRSFCRSTSAVDAFADDCAPPARCSASPLCMRACCLRQGVVPCRAPWPCAAAGLRWGSWRLCVALLPQRAAERGSTYDKQESGPDYCKLAADREALLHLRWLVQAKASV